MSEAQHFIPTALAATVPLSIVQYTKAGHVVKLDTYKQAKKPCKNCGCVWVLQKNSWCVDCMFVRNANCTPEQLARKRQQTRILQKAFIHDSLVYFIWDGNNIKIGQTSNIRMKLQQGLSNNPNCKVLLTLHCGTRKAAKLLETHLHVQFSKDRLPGCTSIISEWFRPSRELIAYIQSRRHEHFGTPGLVPGV